MKNLILLLCMVVLCSPYVAAQSRGEMPFTAGKPNTNALLRQAWSHYADVKFAEGDAIIKQVVKDDPDCGMAYAFLPSDSREEAEANLKLASSKKLSPDEQIFINSMMALVIEKPEQQNFDPLLQKYPKDNNLHLFVMYNTPDNAKAIALGESLAKRSPKYAPIYNLLGYRYMAMQNMAKAEANFNKYMQLRPELANVYDSKGDFMMRNNRFSEAVPLYEKAASMGMEPSLRNADQAKARLKYGAPTDADKESIRKTLSTSFLGYTNGNVDEILAPYSDQSVEIWQNQIANVGLASQRRRAEAMLSSIKFVQEDITIETLDGIGTIAIATAKEKSATREIEGGKEENRAGNVIFMLRKQRNGEWKIIADHFCETREGDPEFSAADRREIYQLFNTWNKLFRMKTPLAEEHLDMLEPLYSKQAIEIMPGQRANVGIANLRTGWERLIGSTYAYSDLGVLGVHGQGNRAVAWGLGMQELTPNGADKPVKSDFPWAMILTKEKDNVWRILTLHWYSQ